MKHPRPFPSTSTKQPTSSPHHHPSTSSSKSSSNSPSTWTSKPAISRKKLHRDGPSSADVYAPLQLRLIKAALGVRRGEDRVLRSGVRVCARSLVALWSRLCYRRNMRSPWEGCSLQMLLLRRPGGQGDVSCVLRGGVRSPCYDVCQYIILKENACVYGGQDILLHTLLAILWIGR